MANQNVGTPRFYINDLTYSIATGQLEIQTTSTNPNAEYLSIINGNPSNTTLINQSYTTAGGGDAPLNLRYTRINRNRPNYIAVLGHNLNSQQMGIRHYYWTNPDEYEWNGGHGLTDIINGENGEIVHPTDTASDFLQPTYDGFSICEVTASDDDYYGLSNLQFAIDTTTEGERQLKIGSIFMGQYYDMPHSPDLSLKMSHEYKGIKKQESMGGSTLTNVNYYKPPDWGNLEAWQLGFFPRKYSGRRIWNLTFSYLSDDKVEPKHYDMDETHSDWKDNWFSNVLHYTMGGALPFIFQPDNSATYTTDDGTGEITAIPELAICRFDMNTFTKKQVAHNMYTISVKIKESW